MALRGFVGDDGKDWEVWDTRPATRSAGGAVAGPRSEEDSARTALNFSLVSAKREGGWLTFTAQHERRRLSPIPSGWETADEATLCSLLARADRIAD